MIERAIDLVCKVTRCPVRSVTIRFESGSAAFRAIGTTMTCPACGGRLAEPELDVNDLLQREGFR